MEVYTCKFIIASKKLPKPATLTPTQADTNYNNQTVTAFLDKLTVYNITNTYLHNIIIIRLYLSVLKSKRKKIKTSIIIKRTLTFFFCYRPIRWLVFFFYYLFI